MASIHPPLPTSMEAFDQDDRISFSKLDNKYIAVHDDGSEFEFDTATKTWALAADDEPLSDEHDAHLADLSRTGSNTPDVGDSRKRKGAPDNDADSTNKKARPAKRAKPPPQPRQNTAVYVTGLPPDATVDEVHGVFSRKAGVVAEEIDSGRPRIKMYADGEGQFKGDALIVFFKPQSVEMAIMLLDDTDFRIDDAGRGSGRIKVQAADSSYKKTKYDENGNEVNGGGEKGNGNGNGNQNGAQRQPQEREKTRGSERDRQKIIKKTQKMDAKLADWSDDEPATISSETTSRWDKIAVLRHMFTLAELEEDPAALLEIKEDIREECEKLGEVTNVVLYDEEPEGVVSVKFRKPEAALACVQLMNGRSFDGRVVEAGISTGRENFKKSKDGDGNESDED